MWICIWVVVGFAMVALGPGLSLWTYGVKPLINIGGRQSQYTAAIRKSDAAYRAGDFAGAESAAREAQGLYSTSEAAGHLGRCLLAQHRLDESEAQYRLAMRIDPTQAICAYNLGMICDYCGEKAEAERRYRQAMKLNPRLSEPVLALAYLLTPQGKYDEAESLLEGARPLHPPGGSIEVGLGMVAIWKKQYEKANGLFEQAVKLAPQRGDVHAAHAYALVYLGRNEEALQALALAEKYGVEEPQTKTMMKQMREQLAPPGSPKSVR
jgi:Flp pilus assembly protein TadD